MSDRRTLYLLLDAIRYGDRQMVKNLVMTLYLRNKRKYRVLWKCWKAGKLKLLAENVRRLL